MSQNFAPDDDNGKVQNSQAHPKSSGGEITSRRRQKNAAVRTLLVALFWQLGKVITAFWRAKPSPPTSHLNRATAGEPESDTPRGRAADQSLELAPGAFAWSWAALWAGIFAALSVAGGVGFLVAYWTHGDTQTLGGLLAVFFAGLALTLTLNARLLTHQKLAVEPRDELMSPAPQCAALAADFQLGEGDMSRRGLLQTLAAAAAGLVAAMSLSLLRSLTPHFYRALDNRIWRRGQKLIMENGRAVRADSLPAGGTVVVFPEDQIGSEEAQTVLIRIGGEARIIAEKNQFSAPQGYLAFSRVCTHAGCPVGLYEKTTHLLMCPCHQSTFDVLRGARPTGGPAARPLPRLPLYIDAHGYLRAGSGFSQPPGPGFWGMPS